jgi:hypothetical protein
MLVGWADPVAFRAGICSGVGVLVGWTDPVALRAGICSEVGLIIARFARECTRGLDRSWRVSRGAVLGVGPIIACFARESNHTPELSDDLITILVFAKSYNVQYKQLKHHGFLNLMIPPLQPQCNFSRWAVCPQRTVCSRTTHTKQGIFTTPHGLIGKNSLFAMWVDTDSSASALSDHTWSNPRLARPLAELRMFVRSFCEVPLTLSSCHSTNMSLYALQIKIRCLGILFRCQTTSLFVHKS